MYENKKHYGFYFLNYFALMFAWGFALSTYYWQDSARTPASASQMGDVQAAYTQLGFGQAVDQQQCYSRQYVKCYSYWLDYNSSKF